MSTTRAWSALPLGFLGAFVVAAAGAGAGGGIYLTQRGVESVVPVTVDRAATATTRAFEELKIHQTKTSTEQESDGEKREVDGTAGDREISVTIKAEADELGPDPRRGLEERRHLGQGLRAHDS